MSGRTYPRDENDWELMNASKLKSKLRALVDQGRCIVVISNQGALDRSKEEKSARLKGLEAKLADVQRALGVPLAFYAGYGKVNRYRKPAPGMWERVTQDFIHKGVVIDKSSSFYCGDAAGRAAGPKPWAGSTKNAEKKNFADTDLRFAVNAGLTFYTPEQLFLGSDDLALDPSACDGLDPSSIPRCAGSPYDGIRVEDEPELVVLVGSPGSGKTSLAKAVFESKGYVWINNDTLKSQEKCATKTSEGMTRPFFSLQTYNPLRFFRGLLVFLPFRRKTCKARASACSIVTASWPPASSYLLLDLCCVLFTRISALTSLCNDLVASDGGVPSCDVVFCVIGLLGLWLWHQLLPNENQ